jgi:glycosyltransferase involved in cell wall biosynthesis
MRYGRHMAGALRLFPKGRMQSATRSARVSVIIPVYNCERYVCAAVESVLAQTYPLHEIIVVDDGSTDTTCAALDRHRDSITYIYQKNAGEPSARNTGIRRASGEYVAFLDADDLWLPEKLRAQMEQFEVHPEYGLVYTDMMTFNESGILVESVRASRGRVYCSGRIFPQLFQETLFGSGSVVFRKACIETAGVFDESFLIGSDYEMWLRMARYFEFGYVDKPLLQYRQHSEMSTQTLGRIPQNGTPWQVKVLESILARYPEAVSELGQAVINRRLGLLYMWLGRAWLDRKDHSMARELISGALHYSPANPRYRLAYFATFLTPSQVSTATDIYRRFRRAITITKPDDAAMCTPAEWRHGRLR